MPIIEGKYHLSFDVPEIYMETVDISFDYPKCKKEQTDFLGLGVLKFDIPKCGKERKVIKFDVPRIRSKRVAIETPYGSKEEFDAAVRKGIDKLLEQKKEFEDQKAETTSELDKKIEDAKAAGETDGNIRRLELLKELELISADEAIAAIDEQVEKLRNAEIED